MTAPATLSAADFDEIERELKAAGLDDPRLLVLVVMARRTAEAEAILHVRDLTIEALHEQDHHNRSVNKDLSVKVIRAEVTVTKLTGQVATLREANAWPRFMDQCDAAKAGNQAIDALIAAADRERCFMHQSEGTLFERDGCYRVLWFHDRPFAAYLIVRDAMNFSVLWQWQAAPAATAPEPREGGR